MRKVFVCYRRSDTGGMAGRIYDGLRAHLGEHAVFRDKASLPGGARYRSEIESEIEHSSALLVLIGQKWMDWDRDGTHSRLHDADDFLCREIQTALKSRRRVIPVLVDGARMPARDDLPESIHDLTEMQAMSVRDDPHFADDIRVVADSLRSPHTRLFRKMRIAAIAAVLCALAAGTMWSLGIDPIDGLRKIAKGLSTPRKPDPSPAAPATPIAETLSDDTIDALVGPIALYPDLLLAEVLAATNYPTEINDAWLRVRGGATVENLEAQDWEDCIRALAAAPDALERMGENLEWVERLGVIYREHPSRVMKRIQVLRRLAAANGSLADSEDVRVHDNAATGAIEIVPAREGEVRVPHYDPAIAFDAPHPGVVPASLAFGDAVAIGPQWDVGIEWPQSQLVAGYEGHHDWGNPKPAAATHSDSPEHPYPAPKAKFVPKPSKASGTAKFAAANDALTKTLPKTDKANTLEPVTPPKPKDQGKLDVSTAHRRDPPTPKGAVIDLPARSDPGVGETSPSNEKTREGQGRAAGNRPRKDAPQEAGRANDDDGHTDPKPESPPRGQIELPKDVEPPQQPVGKAIEPDPSKAKSGDDPGTNKKNDGHGNKNDDGNAGGNHPGGGGGHGNNKNDDGPKKKKKDDPPKKKKKDKDDHDDKGGDKPKKKGKDH